MFTLTLLMLATLPLDAAIPVPATENSPLEITVRELIDGRIATLLIVHTNVSRAPIAVRPTQRCSGSVLDALFFDGAPIQFDPRDRERDLCVPDGPQVRTLAPGESYTVEVTPPFFPGDHTAYATFTIVDARGRALRTLRSPTLTTHHWW